MRQTQNRLWKPTSAAGKFQLQPGASYARLILSTTEDKGADLLGSNPQSADSDPAENHVKGN